MAKYASRTAPLLRQGDTTEMRNFARWATEHGVAYIRPTLFQVKIGLVNYYPDKGTIFVDMEGRVPQKNLTGLEEVLTRLKLLPVFKPQPKTHHP